MANVLLILLLAALAGWALWRVLVRARRGGGCCGERESAPARVAVRDRNRAHYPHEVKLTIGGMTCGNCARRVENALNRMDGVWAEVDIGTRTARVRLKERPDMEALRDAVRQAGYVPMD